MVARSAPALEVECLLSLDVKLNSELVSWILSLGADATVLAPQELAESVNKAALLIIDKYKTKKLLKSACPLVTQLHCILLV